jgi:predicted ferric reductase
MGDKKGQPFPFVIIVIVLGWGIYKQIDFENFKFEKPALTVVYILTFLMSVYFLIRNLRGNK